jgi:acyl-CoA thioester hydrolase
VNEFLWPVRVYYEDTDSGGVVYYANYLKFMERARTEWLRQFGFEQDELIHNEGVIFAVRSVQVDYLLPARFNDELSVSAKLIEQGRASLTIEQKISRVADSSLLCKGSVKIVSLRPDSFKPCAIPDQIKQQINQGA